MDDILVLLAGSPVAKLVRLTELDDRCLRQVKRAIEEPHPESGEGSKQSWKLVLTPEARSQT